MRNLTCIVCPIGCSLDVEEERSSPENISVTGNRCPRGAAYAWEEVRSPKRVVTATCRVKGGAGTVRRVPVKTVLPFPKEKIPSLLEDIYKTSIALPVKAGDVVIAGWKGEGIDVVAVRTVGLS
jgi:CxxC motif-containing protein